MAIIRARHCAELVTDDRDAVYERLEATAGERIAAFETVVPERGKTLETSAESRLRARTPEMETEKIRQLRGIEMEM